MNGVLRALIEESLGRKFEARGRVRFTLFSPEKSSRGSVVL